MDPTMAKAARHLIGSSCKGDGFYATLAGNGSALLSHDIAVPRFQYLPSLLHALLPPVGPFGLVADLVAVGFLDDFAGERCFVAAPVAEARPEAVHGIAAAARDPLQLLQHGVRLQDGNSRSCCRCG